MDIQSAIKSGKPFRRKHPDTLTHRWIRIIGALTGMIHWLDGDNARVGLTANDILADDWEVKQ